MSRHRRRRAYRRRARERGRLASWRSLGRVVRGELDGMVRERLVESLLAERHAVLARLRASRELSAAERGRQELLEQLAALGLRLRALERRPLLAQVVDERDFLGRPPC